MSLVQSKVICILTYGRTGSSFLINLLQQSILHSQKCLVLSEILSHKYVYHHSDFQNISVLNKLPPNISLNDTAIHSYINHYIQLLPNLECFVFKYVLEGTNRDQHIIHELCQYPNIQFIFLDRNMIDCHISNRLAQRNQQYSHFNYTDQLIDIDISEIHDIVNYRLSVTKYICNKIQNIQYLDYDTSLLKTNYDEIIQEINELFLTKFFFQCPYFQYNPKCTQNVISKQNNNSNSILNIRQITNHVIKQPNHEQVTYLLMNTDLSKLHIIDYYQKYQQVQSIHKQKTTVKIYNPDYCIKIHSSINQYLQSNTTQYIFTNQSGAIILTIDCDNYNKMEIIQDSNLFIDMLSYNMSNELNQIVNYYEKNIISLESMSLGKKTPISFIQTAFIIHLDHVIARNTYINQLSQYIANLYYTKAIAYQDSYQVECFCNYLVYRRYFLIDLHNQNMYDSYTMGSICLTLSNLIILRYCQQKNISSFLITEDDIIVHKDLSDIVNCYNELLPFHPDVTYWGIKQDYRDPLDYISSNWYKKNIYSWGTHSYYIHNNHAINEIINCYSTFNRCLDCYQFTNLKTYISKKSFFITDEYNLESSIKENERGMSELIETNNWGNNLADYRVPEKHNFVLFDNLYQNNSSTWSLFVQAIAMNMSPTCKANYNELQLNPNTLVFFDFVDRHFGWDYWILEKKYPKELPFRWGGIIHHPIRLPTYWGNNLSVMDYLSLPYNQNVTLKSCQFLIVLSTQLRDEIHQSGILGDKQIPIYVINHIMPTQTIQLPINLPCRPNKYLLFTGWSFRNYRIFSKLHHPPHLQKIILPGFTTDEQRERFNNLFQLQTSECKNQMVPYQLLSFPDFNQYLDTLSQSIVFMDFDGISANNSVLECIQLNIPMILPKLQALEYYLGKDYPLYYKNDEEAQSFVYNQSLIDNARNYLKQLNKIPFTMTYNVLATLNIINNHN